VKEDASIGSVLFRLADETNCSFVSGEALPIDELNNDSGFIFTDFIRKNAFLIAPTTNISGIWSDIKTQFSHNIFDAINSSEEVSTEKDEYDFGFRIVKNEIEFKKITKAVLSRKMVFDTSSDAIAVFEQLINNYPSSHIYLVKTPSGDIWIGASPETLITANENFASTMSLAGTKKDLDTDWTEKEYAEQKIVTSTILDGLKELDLKTEVSELETVEAGAVYHLRNIITFPTDNHSVAEIAETLHPTPAISGSPKSAAYSTIKIAEPHDREYYCGFGGPLNLNDKSTLFVNLRCAKITTNQTTLFVGGGITEKSVFEDEWKECERKAQSLLRFL
jgi:isochorismate synthase